MFLKPFGLVDVRLLQQVQLQHDVVHVNRRPDQVVAGGTSLDLGQHLLVRGIGVERHLHVVLLGEPVDHFRIDVVAPVVQVQLASGGCRRRGRGEESPHRRRRRRAGCGWSWGSSRFVQGFRRSEVEAEARDHEREADQQDGERVDLRPDSAPHHRQDEQRQRLGVDAGDEVGDDDVVERDDEARGGSRRRSPASASAA